MQQQELMRILHLARPSGHIQMVLDTDAYNEVDDQYALAYALKSTEKLDIKAVYAAPFYSTPFFPPRKCGEKAHSPADGMEKSFHEILRVLALMGRMDMRSAVYRGADRFMQRDGDAVDSAAVRDLIQRAMGMPEGERLYAVCIAAITNVASALVLEPALARKLVVVWLGCHAPHWHNNYAFNFMQDPYAARVVFDCGVPVVQVPGMGVTSHMITTEPELREHLKGKNPLCDYLYDITCRWAADAQCGPCWSKIIWDVAPVAWLVGDDSWMETALVHSPVVNNNQTQSTDRTRHLINQVQHIYRDRVFADLFAKLTR